MAKKEGFVKAQVKQGVDFVLWFFVVQHFRISFILMHRMTKCLGSTEVFIAQHLAANLLQLCPCKRRHYCK